LQLRQVSAIIIVVGIICLALGVAAGYGLNSGKTVTTSLVQTSTLTETQITTAVEKVNVTVTPYCCVDPNLTIATPCGAIAAANYPPVQRLQDSVETDPDFIAAENGLNYVDITNGPGCSSTLNNGTVVNGTIQGTVNSSTVNFQFAYTIDRLYTDNCGDVENFTYYLYVNVPLTETGYNMSAIQIIPSNSSEITISCSTTIPTQNTTVTIAGTTST
jgi:hypothetical protein